MEETAVLERGVDANLVSASLVPGEVPAYAYANPVRGIVSGSGCPQVVG